MPRASHPVDTEAKDPRDRVRHATRRWLQEASQSMGKGKMCFGLKGLKLHLLTEKELLLSREAFEAVGEDLRGESLPWRLGNAFRVLQLSVPPEDELAAMLEGVGYQKGSTLTQGEFLMLLELMKARHMTEIRRTVALGEDASFTEAVRALNMGQDTITIDHLHNILSTFDLPTPDVSSAILSPDPDSAPTSPVLRTASSVASFSSPTPPTYTIDELRVLLDDRELEAAQLFVALGAQHPDHSVDHLLEAADSSVALAELEAEHPHWHHDLFAHSPTFKEEASRFGIEGTVVTRFLKEVGSDIIRFPEFLPLFRHLKLKHLQFKKANVFRTRMTSFREERASIAPSLPLEPVDLSPRGHARRQTEKLDNSTALAMRMRELEWRISRSRLRNQGEVRTKEGSLSLDPDRKRSRWFQFNNAFLSLQSPAASTDDPHEETMSNDRDREAPHPPRSAREAHRPSKQAAPFPTTPSTVPSPPPSRQRPVRAPRPPSPRPATSPYSPFIAMKWRSGGIFLPSAPLKNPIQPAGAAPRKPTPRRSRPHLPQLPPELLSPPAWLSI